MSWKNKLYFGDNLPILKEYIADESVDLVYLDPPFNSNANYNVLFKEKSGERSHAQITAFEDTWEWGVEAEETYYETIERSGRLSDFLQAFRSIIGPSDMMAYLVMMAPRLRELHRVLKPTGSIYLRCDPTASHYLKLLMDAIFGGENYQSEITWKRTTAHSDAKQGRKGFGNINDILLYYSKSDEFTFNPQYQPYTEEYTKAKYPYADANGRRSATRPREVIVRSEQQLVVWSARFSHWGWNQRRLGSVYSRSYCWRVTISSSVHCVAI